MFVHALLLALLACCATHNTVLAGPAPRGWNSYDGYGGAVNETQLLITADYVAKYLKPFGYTSLTLDEVGLAPIRAKSGRIASRAQSTAA